MLWREHLVGRLQRSAEIGDQGVDVEEWPTTLTSRTLAAGDGGDVGASGVAEDTKSLGAVRVYHRAGCNMAVAERGRRLVGEAVNHAHDDRTHAPARPTLDGADDAGLTGGAATLVTLATEIDVVIGTEGGFHDRRPTALGRRAQ